MAISGYKCTCTRGTILHQSGKTEGIDIKSKLKKWKELVANMMDALEHNEIRVELNQIISKKGGSIWLTVEDAVARFQFDQFRKITSDTMTSAVLIFDENKSKVEVFSSVIQESSYKKEMTDPLYMAWLKRNTANYPENGYDLLVAIESISKNKDSAEDKKETGDPNKQTNSDSEKDKEEEDNNEVKGNSNNADTSEKDGRDIGGFDTINSFFQSSTLMERVLVTKTKTKNRK